MKTLRVGVVGLGSIARNRHLPELENNPNTEITAVCDVVPSRSEEIAKEYNATAYTEYEELIEDPRIDAVIVCAANHLHAPVSIAALQAGKHVLCEKPMATTLEEADDMIAAQKASGKLLLIAHNQCFVPSHQKARKMIQNGELGKIFSFRTTFGHGGPEQWSIDGKNSWFFDKDKAYIGALGDLGVHKSHLIEFLLDEPIQEVAAFVDTLAKPYADVDDNAVAVLRTKSGIIGTLTASWSYVADEDNSTIIYGEKGVIRLEESPEYSLVVEYHNGDRSNHSLGAIQTNDSDTQSNSGVVDAFASCVLDSSSNCPITAEKGRSALAVILAALDSNGTKKIISLAPETVEKGEQA
ncbi:Gfo/Idh/MocA family protein [Terribacillus saccharophilus]|uniref:Dehydrogenase n=1 Tax=Terribacillus saccharophilus TaxID=361277 RepID=A0A268AF36_9BACI|nr:Gfo/Idh/MocA family oxidoreductase [Terribacillus saccharophilus]PAD22737.1 dehydrogenase [Terribacillus saccharophilus]PAF18209.1 dehydrogenase [Terribacillus saccharophilus]PAF23639.1 dehydrogenase [Terribacillus saccharophilus]PAF37316.1 dehydrogenase [Terribacillus saccharophilus]PAF39842.1 dehydrogenase [Terribacillus saccharophilus]